jgi:hypothetical protein
MPLPVADGSELASHLGFCGRVGASRVSRSSGWWFARGFDKVDRSSDFLPRALGASIESKSIQSINAIRGEAVALDTECDRSMNEMLTPASTPKTITQAGPMVQVQQQPAAKASAADKMLVSRSSFCV